MKNYGFLSGERGCGLLDSYVGNGVVVHQAKHCRVHDNESYRVVTKRVPEVPSEGRQCSL